MVSRLMLLSAVAVPTVAIGLRLYHVEQPLSASRTRTIRTQATLPSSCASSSSLGTVNPNHHRTWTDSFSISLSEREIGHTSDEELLSRFVKGFFGGWTFTPESSILKFLHGFGRRLIPVGFSNVQPRDSVVLSPSELSRTSLPPAHTLLFYGNFLVLDVCLQPPCSDDLVDEVDSVPDSVSAGTQSSSYIDIAFGDNRKSFAGFHRFEVTRETDQEGQRQKSSGGATICFSSVACNPSVERSPGPTLIYTFHKVYAMTLFRDGIAGVLQA